jgi:hypothetical protein
MIANGKLVGPWEKSTYFLTYIPRVQKNPKNDLYVR